MNKTTKAKTGYRSQVGRKKAYPDRDTAHISISLPTDLIASLDARVVVLNGRQRSGPQWSRSNLMAHEIDRLVVLWTAEAAAEAATKAAAVKAVEPEPEPVPEEPAKVEAPKGKGRGKGGRS